MGSEPAEAVHAPQYTSCTKVYYSICQELTKVIEKIRRVLPAIEAARPGCTVGIQELCALNNTIEKSKLLIQHCAESSKLYLAITGESIVLRCERIRSSMNHSLCLVQSMVPQIVVVQIDKVLDYLRDAKFVINSTEYEAGKAMIELLGQTDSSEEVELKAFQTAASCLKITSPKALLIERRSIKKLLDKLNGSDPKKEKILNYFLYLIKKYGKKVKADNGDDKSNCSPLDKCLDPVPISTLNSRIVENSDESNGLGKVKSDSVANNIPPEEFCCPISSRLMYDPVVISSGQTFERVSIEKWFNEGHDTCPKTQKKLRNLYMIPNSCMKDLISNWCSKNDVILEDPSSAIQSWDSSCCSSISSLKNVSAALLDGRSGDYTLHNDSMSVSIVSTDSYCSDSSHVKAMDNQLFDWSDDYLRCQSFSNFSHDMYLRFFGRMRELPLDHQGKSVDDMKKLLEGDEQLCYAMLSNGFAEALMTFLKNAYDRSDVHTQRTGLQIFLAFLSNNRVEIPSLSEDAFQMLTTFLESEITLEALLILQKLAHDPKYKSYLSVSGLPPPIIKILDWGDHEFVELAIKILLNLSSHRELRSHIVSSGCIEKLVPLMTDGRHAEFCIKLLRNLSDVNEAVVLIAEATGCIASIAELLETGTREDQEHGVAILHSLCSQRVEYCLLVMKEGVIPSLVSISVNGNANGKEISMKLLHLLKDLRLSGSFESTDPQSGSTTELAAEESTERCMKRQPVSKPSGFFGRKMRVFLKARSVALS